MPSDKLEEFFLAFKTIMPLIGREMSNKKYLIEFKEPLYGWHKLIITKY